MALTLSVLLSFGPALVYADSTYKLAVIDVSEGQNAEAMAAVAKILEALQVHPQVDYRASHRLLDAGGHDDQYGNVASAQKAFDEGRRYYQRGEYSRARTSLESGMLFVNASFGYIDQAGLIADTMLYLAASQHEEAREGLSDDVRIDDARATLRVLLIHFPSYVYARSRFEDAFNTLFDEVRTAVGKRAKGDVRIDTDTSLPAMAYVDGIFRGVTPVSVFGLIEGEHFVRLVAQGYAVSQARAQVRPGQTARVALEMTPAGMASVLDPMIPALRKNLEGTEISAGVIQELKSLLFTDYAILVRAVPAAAGTEVHAGLFSLHSGARIRTSRAIFGRQPRAATTLVDRILKVEEPPVPTGRVVTGTRRSVFTRWWFWTGAAVLVGGAVTAIVLATKSETEPSPFEKGDTGALFIRF